MLQSQLPLLWHSAAGHELFEDLLLVYHFKAKVLELLYVELLVGTDDPGVDFEHFGLAVDFEDIADYGFIKVNFNDCIYVRQYNLEIIHQPVYFFP